MSDNYRLLATDHEGRVYLAGARFHEYADAIEFWRLHDDARLAGLRPQVKHYEVRAESDPKVKEAHLHPKPILFSDTLRKSGWKQMTEAARTWIHADTPQRPDGRVNGVGGWFYLRRRVFAQGKLDLADRLFRRGLLAQDAKGRWHAPAVSQ